MSFFVYDVNWNNISYALARYAEDSDAFMRNSSRRLHSLRADVARGKVEVMTPELGWDRQYYEDPVGDVHDIPHVLYVVMNTFSKTQTIFVRWLS